MFQWLLVVRGVFVPEMLVLKIPISQFRKCRVRDPLAGHWQDHAAAAENEAERGVRPRSRLTRNGVGRPVETGHPTGRSRASN